MASLGDFLRGGRNPADAAMPFLDQIPDIARQNYNPYIHRGDAAYQTMQKPYEQMAQDPAGFLEQLMKHYEPSRGYQLKRDEALRAAGNTAAAGGMRGSLQDIEHESRLADSLLGDDMQQWFANVFGLQGRGLEGEQHFYDTGYDATRNLTGDLSNILGTKAGLAFQGQADKNQRQSDLFSGLMKAFGGIAGLGLPGGGTLAGKIASRFI